MRPGVADFWEDSTPMSALAVGFAAVVVGLAVNPAVGIVMLGSVDVLLLVPRLRARQDLFDGGGIDAEDQAHPSTIGCVDADGRGPSTPIWADQWLGEDAAADLQGRVLEILFEHQHAPTMLVCRLGMSPAAARELVSRAFDTGVVQ
jgi:hypothetical protein